MEISLRAGLDSKQGNCVGFFSSRTEERELHWADDMGIEKVAGLGGLLPS